MRKTALVIGLLAAAVAWPCADAAMVNYKATLGGTAEVRAAPGGGASVVVRIPLASAHVAASTPASPPARSAQLS